MSSVAFVTPTVGSHASVQRPSAGTSRSRRSTCVGSVVKTSQPPGGWKCGKWRCKSERRVVTRCSMETSPSSGVPPISSSSSGNKAIREFASLGLLVGTDRALSVALTAMNISFPSALFGMLSMFALLLLLDAVQPKAASKLVAIYKPGVDFISRWLAVCFAPSLVVLPLAPMPGSADLVRTAIVLVFGWLVSALSIAALTLALQKVSASGKAELPPAAVSVTTPPSKQLVQALASLTILFFAVSVATSCNNYAVAGYTLLSTVLGFSAGNLLPKKVKKLFHPLLVCAASALASIFALAKVSGLTFRNLLSGYLTRSSSLSMLGGGDILMSLLGPAVLSFAFQMYGRKQLMRERAVEVFGASFVAAVTGLFGTAFFARAIGCSEYVCLFLIPRQLTAPLAIRAADIIGAPVGLTLSAVVITGLIGANFIQSLLDLVNVKDPAARGLAAGCSSHGLGTAAIVSEPDAFAFSAIGMALVALMSTLLVLIPPVRVLLLRIALSG